MRADRSSHTAEGAAAMRAAGCFEADAAIRNPDDLARALISPRHRALVQSPILRRLALGYYGLRLPGLYEAHLARTHHFDHRVQEQLVAGVSQLVVLGAGFDTRPYRLRALVGEGRVFEVDHPATSAEKRSRVAAAGFERDHVTYVEVDFERQSVEPGLLDHGFRPDVASIITWEGVVPYLDASSVRDMLRFVASLAPGTSILFDYVYRSFFESPERYPTARRHLSYVEKLDEPYRFGLERDEMTELVKRCGLTVVDHVDADEMHQRYLRQHRGRITPWYALIHARVG